jgi:hypothetical protein
MMDKIGMILVSMTFSLMVVSCGWFEESKYIEGNPKKNGPNHTDEGDEKPKDDDAIPNGENPTDTGLTECISDFFTATQKPTYQPPKIDQTIEDFSDVTIGSAQDFKVLTDLILRKIVRPSDGFVDYAALRGPLKSPWEKVMAALRTLQPPSASNTSQAIAYWINAYNLQMIDFVRLSPEETSALKVFNGGSPFGSDAAQSIGGYQVALNGIENGILGMSGSMATHPASQVIESRKENRVHFSLVCGAVSCPKLRNFLYPDDDQSLEAVLEENSHLFFNSVYHVRSESGVQVSQLMQWYTEDFSDLGGGDLANLVSRYVLSECRNDANILKQAFSEESYQFWDYIWNVNSQ